MATQETPLIQARGLEGVVALDSELCFIDGQQGTLIYRGYDIFDLARHTSFEEVAYLLWNGHLPNRSERDELLARLQAERTLPPMVAELLGMTPEDASPMAVLRSAVSALALFDAEADDPSPEANYRKAIRLTARIPVLLAAFDRRRKGLPPVPPRKHGSTAFDFLHMLTGEEPGEAAERTFDTCLVLHAEHGLNASTFAARVIGATLSDIYSAVTGAIGALKGPLHGGANIEVMRMLLEIDRTGRDPVQYVKEKLARKERVMGFGHRVYKTLDPRAAILRDMVEALSEERGQRKWYDYSMKIMETMEREKGLYPNVDFFSAPVYYMLGIAPDLFTPIFAMSRITGWTAHLLEQWKDNRLIRPRAAYVGPRNLAVRPLDER
ncbi:citrate synthase [Rhodocaloribacter litoris]|uniref:citrate synthase n=1 Tax=Rhodocaloribacter litoris TaxID=2558931 RepID=UPI001423FC94|nr:citrate synthase [Rhodocaloribacter litoris]QXD16632.1 citrate synthase [Rhodocaloribacter litoris]